jgi:hypothetical protein
MIYDFDAAAKSAFYRQLRIEGLGPSEIENKKGISPQYDSPYVRGRRGKHCELF